MVTRARLRSPAQASPVRGTLGGKGGRAAGAAAGRQALGRPRRGASPQWPAGTPPPRWGGAGKPWPGAEPLVRRHGRTGVVVVLLVAAGLVAADLAGGGTGSVERARLAARPAGASAAATAPDPGAVTIPGALFARGVLPKPAAAPGMGAGSPRSPRFPVTGPGTFGYASGTGPVLGASGTLRRFRVAVESGTGHDAASFATAVERTLADPRGWTASGRLRLQRVPRSASAQFTVFLATPGTSEKMCAVGGLRTERFTNCRVSDRVIINLARWSYSVPGYHAPLAEYRAYVVNHEVGHELGWGHQACPGRGRLAPVMQQQTLGLKGCRANGWPYVNGRRYAGRGIP